MIDPTIQTLLERVIDSPLKLQLVLMFNERTLSTATPSEVAQRVYRDIWTTREALRELAEDGVLVTTASRRDEPTYAYRPQTDHIEPIRLLMRMYNEPMERETINRTIREIASDAPYRRAVRGGFAYETVRL